MNFSVVLNSKATTKLSQMDDPWRMMQIAVLMLSSTLNLSKDLFPRLYYLHFLAN
jgi:hypothetical protein